MEEGNNKTEEKMKKEEKKIVSAVGEGKVESKEKKKEEVEKKEKIKKDKSAVNGRDLSISTKQAMAICRFIKGKKIEQAVNNLELVVRKKRAVPMKGEIPHRKGMAGGRYPINASKIFIMLLKSLNANSAVNGLEEPYISTAIANKAPQPYRRFGSRRFKRTHVYLEAREKTLKENKAKEEEKAIKQEKSKENKEEKK